MALNRPGERAFCLGPWGASSAKPIGPCSSKRLRHWITVGREVDRQAAIALFDRPSAANRQMRARRTVRCGLVLARRQASSVARCSFVIFRDFAFSHMPQTITRWGGIVKILLGHDTSVPFRKWLDAPRASMRRAVLRRATEA